MVCARAKRRPATSAGGANRGAGPLPMSPQDDWGCGGVILGRDGTRFHTVSRQAAGPVGGGLSRDMLPRGRFLCEVVPNFVISAPATSQTEAPTYATPLRVDSARTFAGSFDNAADTTNKKHGSNLRAMSGYCLPHRYGEETDFLWLLSPLSQRRLEALA